MGKTVMITGATSGIGEACALRFAKEGYDVAITGRNADKLKELENLIREKYAVDVISLRFDVRDRQAVKEALKSLSGKWANVDILVNNAGLALGLDKEYEGSFVDWDIMIDTNVKGMLNMIRMMVPFMVERGSGHIINIGSVAGDAAYANGNVYCATKAAVKLLSDGLRIDLVDTPIRVTNVKPGIVETNFSVTRFHGDKKKADNVYKGIKPLTGDDIADVVYYAASAPAHVQIAEVLVLATHQASGSVMHRE